MSTAFYIAVTLISGPNAAVTRTMTTAESSPNELLVRWCTDQKVIFTWARRGNKNDGAHVAKKSWARVRELFGYYGYDTAGINEIWALDALFTNYLLPRQKLLLEQRNGAKLTNKEDKAMTDIRRAPTTGYVRHLVQDDTFERRDRSEQAVEHSGFAGLVASATRARWSKRSSRLVAACG
jgi:hypothetical protein